jgi:8-oxo-dGTP diphosphatase
VIPILVEKRPFSLDHRLNEKAGKRFALIKKPIKQIHVSCGIIHQDDNILAVQRSDKMRLPLKWEFPGGKIEPGESPSECLQRELMEELDLHVLVGKPLNPLTHNYPTFIVTLYPFICTIESGAITLHEHAAFAWLSPSKLPALDWAEADRPVLDAYLKILEIQRSIKGDVPGS